MKTVTIHANEYRGKIKKLNGLGGGPRSSMFTYNAVKEFRDAGIPFGRTHDIEYPLGAGEFVDIHNIFRDFDRDPADPAAYNFVLTDAYLEAMLDAGTKPFYRLGTSIEHQKIKRYTYAPKDFTKWAQVCSHIVAHYNEGWADGYHMGIEYWEIWNEPDISECWLGTYEEYYLLYEITAKLLKKEHPEIKVGGPTVTTPDSRLTEPFLAYVKETGAPLDFFSWHGYCHTPKEARYYADRSMELLKKYGFDHTESVYDEWNYICDWGKNITLSMNLHKTAFGAAFTSGVLTMLQDSDIDISILYDGQVLASIGWNSFFSPAPSTAHAGECGVICEKPYYVLKAWSELARTGEQIAAEIDCPDIYVTAVRGEKEIKALVTYFNDDECHNYLPPKDDDVTFLLDGAEYTSVSARILDNDRTEEEVTLAEPSLFMKGNETTVLLTFTLK